MSGHKIIQGLRPVCQESLMSERRLRQIWYLAVQDGRLNNTEYTTHKAANNAYKKLWRDSPMLAKSVCIMTYEKELRR